MGGSQSTDLPVPTIDPNSTPEVFLCPISYELMEEPVMCADGHTYEQANIQQWFNERRGGHVLSPLTGAPLSNTNLTPNYALKKAIADYQEGLLISTETLSDHSARMQLGLGDRPAATEVRIAFHELARTVTASSGAGLMRRLCDAYILLTVRPMVTDPSVYLLLTEAVQAEKERCGPPTQADHVANPVLNFSPKSDARLKLSLSGGMQATVTPESVTGINALSVSCGFFDSFGAFQTASTPTLSVFLVTRTNYAEVQNSLLLGTGVEALCADGPLGAGLQLHLRPFDAFAYAEIEQQRDRHNRHIVMINLSREQSHLLQVANQPGSSDGMVERAIGPRQPNLLVPTASVAAAQLTPVHHLEPDTANWRQLRRLTMGIGVGLPVPEAMLLFFKASGRRE